MRYYSIFLFIAAISACTNPNVEGTTAASTAEESSTQIPDGFVALDLSSYGSMVDMMIPGRNSQGVDATVLVDDLSGYVTISAGKGFQIVLREEPTTLEEINQELQNDLMWSNEIRPYDDQSIVIKRSLPDGSMENYHFASVQTGAGTNVVLRSDPMLEFTEKQIERMLSSAITLKTEQGLAETLEH